MYEYLDGGADSERTLRRNEEALDALLWLPRLAIDMGHVDVSTTLFGKALAMPLVIAPTGFNGMFWRNGDLELARAAAEAGVGIAQSTVSMNTVDEVAGVPGLRHWFQLYAYGGREVVERLLQRALDAGSEALVITIDGAVPGNRVWDQRNYVSPGQLNWRSKVEILRHPNWLSSVLLKGGPPNFVNLTEFVGTDDPSVFETGRWIAENRPKLAWEDIARIRETWPRKLLIKGILRTDEAVRASDIGADGIILSNHGGRQMEPTIAPIEVLPRIRDRMGADFPIVIDSGYRHGAHIAVALALGANAVMTGRGTLYGLAAGGWAGAAKALEIFKTELQRTMALAGVEKIADLNPECLQKDEARAALR